MGFNGLFIRRSGRFYEEDGRDDVQWRFFLQKFQRGNGLLQYVANSLSMWVEDSSRTSRNIKEGVHQVTRDIDMQIRVATLL